MGYYSEVMIAVTKKDFKKVEDAQAKMTENLLDYVNKHDYKENNKDCVFMYWDSLKYYKEFEEVQALEKSASINILNPIILDLFKFFFLLFF